MSVNTAILHSADTRSFQVSVQDCLKSIFSLCLWKSVPEPTSKKSLTYTETTIILVFALKTGVLLFQHCLMLLFHYFQFVFNTSAKNKII